MDFDKTLISILKHRTGLDARRLSAIALANASKRRMKITQIKDLNQYTQTLQSDKAELDRFIDEIVVAETWFFRDLPPTGKLLSLVKDSTNILCIPCASGEEPYSIAMILLENGVSRNRFNIDAIDIHTQSIVKAKSGIYSERSFRNKNYSAIVDSCFSTIGTYQQIQPRLKSAVNFKQLNLFSRQMEQYRDHYDIVFCRNLLIYFAHDERFKAYNILHNILKSNGVLLMSQAESATVPTELFSYAPKISLCSFYKRVKRNKAVQNPDRTMTSLNSITRENETLQIPDNTMASLNSITRKDTAIRSRNNSVWKKPIGPDTGNQRSASRQTLITPQTPNPKLEKAWELANRGLYSEALNLCQQIIKTEKYNDDAYFLLAIINDSFGRSAQSEIFLRKTLYLNPRHHHALIHLSLLVEINGDTEGAQRLRERANRIEAELPPPPSKEATHK